MEVRVRKGDTLWYYNQLFGVPFQLLLDSNRLVNPVNLEIGATVAIPGFTQEEYKVKSGDTIWKLARSRNILPDALFLLNPEIDAENLQAGESLLVPNRVVKPIVNAAREYDYKTMMRDIKRLQEIYPFLRTNSIGKSELGKDLPEILIGNGSKKVHINGSFHANEWITTTMIMTFINEYVLALTNFQQIRGLLMEPLYHKTMLSIVPMVNPDGVDLVLHGPPETEPYKSRVVEINNGSLDFQNWKANIRGVDLNNQFPAKWEIEKERKEPKLPAPRDYPGDTALSEPEVIAMVALTEKSQFSRVLAFHTQGKEIYWGYEGFEPQESKRVVDEFSRVSGYKAVRYVDSHAGYKDWYIQEWKKAGFTIELGEGVNPLPIEQFNDIYKESLGIFLAAMYM